MMFAASPIAKQIHRGLGILVVLILCSMQVTAQSTAPNHLKVSEGFINPIGFYDATPTFSWLLPADGSVLQQKAYRVLVATSPERLPERADLWDSGKVVSGDSVWVSYEGKALTSRQRVYWQIRFWDEQDQPSPWSEMAFFELGLLNNADWSGQWIRMQDEKTPRVSVSDKIQILKAIYGAPGQADKQIDVTKRLKNQLLQGNTIVEASNAMAGYDPAYGVVKQLVLNYSRNNKKTHKVLAEGTKYDMATGKVGRGSSTKIPYVPEYLRKEFQLPSDVTHARLYVTAKGLYEIYINGQRVGHDYMAPGWTPYHKRIETVTYDITTQLQKGENALGVILGEGWYAGTLMRKKLTYPQVIPQLLLQLEIVRSDGQRQIIVTDGTWKGTNRGPIRFSGIYDGEVYDARMEMPDWHTVGFDDQDWKAVHTTQVDATVPLVPKRHNTTRITQSLPTLNITEPEPGRFVFDLGQNMVGWPELKIPVKKDQTITVRVAEMLEQDGRLYTENYRSAKSTDYYTAARNGTVTWHPTFTFHGYRYVELSGFSKGVKPQKHWVTGKVLHSDFKQTGQFKSSHVKLNQLQQNIMWGQRGNYLDIPTDCPQRNERLGWTGDAQVFCPTSFFNYDVHSFWTSWLQSVREEQAENGLISHVVPDVLDGKGSPGWGDVGVTSPWDIYVRTGNREVLEDNYAMMQAWTAAYADQAKGWIVNRKGYGDWLQPYPVSKNNRADTPMEVIATAYFGRCSKIMAETARILGRSAEADMYQKQFQQIQGAFTKAFFDTSGKLTTPIPTQTAYLMALGFDLLEADRRAGATENLLILIDEAGGHLRTGFLGTPLIAFVLDDCGHTDVAYKVLFKETYPSWFYSINQGATTMWERWNSYSHEDGFGNAGMNSFNHYAYGAIGQWMYERMAGLAADPEHPGYKHFFIQPGPGGPVTMAEATLETPYGIASSAWKLQGNTLNMKVIVPPNTTATLLVPQIKASTPKVMVNGRSCQMLEENGRYRVSLQPGTFTIKVQ